VSDIKPIIWLVALWFIWKRGQGVWADEDMRQLAEISKDVDVDPEHVLAVYTSESLLKPSATSGIAWGLAQITIPTLRKLGWQESGEDFGRLSVAQQLPYIKKLLTAQRKTYGKRPETALDLYVLNFAPSKAAKKTAILYDSKVPRERPGYSANKGLDMPVNGKRKGNITRDDLAFRLRQAMGTSVYRDAVSQLNRVISEQAP